MGSMPFKFGLKMVGIDIITRSSGGAEGTCDTTRWAASCVPRRSRNAAFAAWLLTITRLRAHTDRACQGLLMEDCEARAGDLYALEDRNGLGWCLCWLRQLLLERSDGHRPDEVCGQREVHEGVVGRMDRDRAKTFFSTFLEGNEAANFLCIFCESAAI